MKKNIFVRSWQGKATLTEAFWLVYILYGIVLDLIVIMLFNLLIKAFTFTDYHPLIFTITSPYTLFAAICVWRSSRKSELTWMLLARGLVLIGLLGDVIYIRMLFI